MINAEPRPCAGAIGISAWFPSGRASVVRIDSPALLVDVTVTAHLEPASAAGYPPAEQIIVLAVSFGVLLVDGSPGLGRVPYLARDDRRHFHDCWGIARALIALAVVPDARIGLVFQHTAYELAHHIPEGNEEKVLRMFDKYSKKQSSKWSLFNFFRKKK